MHPSGSPLSTASVAKISPADDRQGADWAALGVPFVTYTHDADRRSILSQDGEPDIPPTMPLLASVAHSGAKDGLHPAAEPFAFER
jgi:hypothetical protein